MKFSKVCYSLCLAKLKSLNVLNITKDANTKHRILGDEKNKTSMAESILILSCVYNLPVCMIKHDFATRQLHSQ